jgi:predicted TPR repeat methyltransferase
MSKKSPIEIFSEWVDLGKDDGMEKNHSKSVSVMLNKVLKNLKTFTFLDAGCGNGWVVRKVSKLKNCVGSIGVDGSLKMIKKARNLDSINNYECAELSTWKPNKKIDVVHSMEVLYYFKNPTIVLKNIYENWMNIGGRFIMGIDFYFENTISHDWPEKTNVDTMTLLKTEEWVSIIDNVGFKNIEYWRVGEKDDWKGTLIISATKN